MIKNLKLNRLSTLSKVIGAKHPEKSKLVFTEKSKALKIEEPNEEALKIDNYMVIKYFLIL